MRYIRAISIGLIFSLLIDVFGVLIGLARVLLSGKSVDYDHLISVFLGIGAKEGLFGGAVLAILAIIGGSKGNSSR